MPNLFAEKSNKTWQEGNDCLNAGQVNTAANRIYYSVFQAVFGFAVHAQLVQMHEPVDQVHQYAMRIAREYGSHSYRGKMSLLLSYRITADYKPEDVDGARLNLLLKDADNIRQYFLNKCKD